MNSEIEKVLEVYKRNQGDSEQQFCDMEKDGCHYWSVGSSIYDDILNCAYFDDSRDIEQYIDLAVKFDAYYDIEKDPWSQSGARPTESACRNKLVHALASGTIDHNAVSTYGNLIRERYNLKIQKSNLADLEEYLFVFYIENGDASLAEKIITINDRSLTRAFLNLEADVNSTSLGQYKSAFNKNRRNIVYDCFGGYFQIMYFYQKVGRLPTLFEFREAQLKGFGK